MPFFDAFAQMSDSEQSFISSLSLLAYSWILDTMIEKETALLYFVGVMFLVDVFFLALSPFSQRMVAIFSTDYEITTVFLDSHNADG